jgi:hypothetical protein
MPSAGSSVCGIAIHQSMNLLINFHKKKTKKRSWIILKTWSGSSDQPKDQRNDSQDEKNVNESGCTVNKNAEEPSDDQDHGYYIKNAAHK